MSSKLNAALTWLFVFACGCAVGWVAKDRSGERVAKNERVAKEQQAESSEASLDLARPVSLTYDFGGDQRRIWTLVPHHVLVKDQPRLRLEPKPNRALWQISFHDGQTKVTYTVHDGFRTPITIGAEEGPRP